MTADAGEVYLDRSGSRAVMVRCPLCQDPIPEERSYCSHLSQHSWADLQAAPFAPSVDGNDEAERITAQVAD